MTWADRQPPPTTPGNPTYVFGIVLPALERYRDLVHLCATSSAVASTDFTYSAPLYKGSTAIKEALERTSSALEKFDVYFHHGVLDEEERLRFGHLFRIQYLRKHPGSERQDVFAASGDVLKFAFELVPPLALDEPLRVLDAIEKTPHDKQALGRIKAGEAIDRAHLRAEMKIFFDHIMNPRRREVPQVVDAARDLECEQPYVIELVTDGAIPGYIYFVVAPLVHQVGGRMVLLPG